MASEHTGGWRTEFTPGPWFVIDLRNTRMRELGWTGDNIDTILITNCVGKELQDRQGADSVIARIKFDHRPEELTNGNIADARLIAASPALYALAEAVAKHFEGTDSPLGEQSRAALALTAGET